MDFREALRLLLEQQIDDASIPKALRRSSANYSLNGPGPPQHIISGGGARRQAIGQYRAYQLRDVEMVLREELAKRGLEAYADVMITAVRVADKLMSLFSIMYQGKQRALGHDEKMRQMMNDAVDGYLEFAGVVLLQVRQQLFDIMAQTLRGFDRTGFWDGFFERD